jgi:1,4-dihydroxy-6-naphthoate synthase
MRTLRVAHSPDSDDAFMFWGIATGAVKAEGIAFEQALSDIESANAAAREGTYDLTAISVGAYPYLADRYLLLDSGASFGDGYGPILAVPIGSPVMHAEDLAGKRIAVPGLRTSAALALRLRLPEHQAVPMDFKGVGPAAKRGEVDAALVIHEGQLTAAAEGLRVIEDLGRWWNGRTGLPLPLGMNAIRRDLPEDVRRKAAVAWKASIDLGLARRREALDYAMSFARGLPRDQADRFVGMYVNDWTRELGPRGREAVARFLGEGADRGLVPRVAIEYQAR